MSMFSILNQRQKKLFKNGIYHILIFILICGITITYSSASKRDHLSFCKKEKSQLVGEDTVFINKNICDSFPDSIPCCKYVSFVPFQIDNQPFDGECCNHTPISDVLDDRKMVQKKPKYQHIRTQPSYFIEHDSFNPYSTNITLTLMASPQLLELATVILIS